MSILVHPAQLEDTQRRAALAAIKQALKGQVSEESLVDMTVHYDEDQERSIIVWEQGCYEWPFDYHEKMSDALRPLGLWYEPCNHWSVAIYWL